MRRKTLGNNGVVTNSLGNYPEATRQAAAEENVPLIDLYKMSKTLYEALGPENINHEFVDGNHHAIYGSCLLAKCVVEGIRANQLRLAQFIVLDTPVFDPAKPDRYETFAVQLVPSQPPIMPPDGN